jgi:hypothetical protein
MEAWLSWAIVLTIGGALYFYYTQKDQSGRPRGRSLQRAPITNASALDPSSWLDSNAKSKPASKQAKTKAPRKTVKKTVQDVGEKAAAYVSGASSTADADDDQSSAASPSLGATLASKLPSGKDVSDMLESSGVAPAVLKISGSEKPARPAKPQQQRTESTQETKKQRQNRKKVEEAKAQREADEKERKILMEKTRRTARESRMEPAKNGLQPAKAPSSSAWAEGPSKKVTSSTSNNQLLDTFEPADVSGPGQPVTNNKASTTESLANGHYANLPDEDEQMRMAMADSQWTSVTKKPRKSKAPEDTTDDGSDSGSASAPVVKHIVTKPVESVRTQSQSRFAALSEQAS